MRIPRRIGRVTCDIDSLDEGALAHAIAVVRQHGFIRDIVFNISSSGNGFHLVAWHRGRGVFKRRLLKIREEAGDDPVRIRLDGLGHRQINVLFTRKVKK
ncbi:MAG: hypothetical protein PHU95_02315 [Candidatus Thermoplasmatota archaeon]|nr:hypothetical protein [Candidatus Thermoplasmatota archaeon]MDD5778266.1 hypothetical protein [Candidatus Thermoplasmatota archaeon]